MSEYFVRRVSSATRLQPPLVVGGKSYTHAVIFEADTPRAGAKKVGEWIIHSATSTQVRFGRGQQTSSWTIPPEAPGRGTTEIVYASTTGGNAVDSHERDRVYSAFNPMAQRGSLAHSRIIAGDALFKVAASRRIPLEIISTQAYGHAPASVNYNAGINLLAGYSENPGTGLGVNFEVIPEGCQAVFDGPLTGVSAAKEDFSEVAVLTRKIFDGDPDRLPADLAMVGGEFWWNPITLEARLSNLQSATLPVMTLAYWLQADPTVGVLQEPAGNLKWADGGGIDDFVSTSIEDGDFDVTLTVIPEGGAALVRIGLVGGRGAYLSFDEDMVLDGYGYREGTGAWLTAGFDFSGYTPDPTNLLAIRFRRDGTRFRIDVAGSTVLDEATSALKGGMLIGAGQGVFTLTGDPQDLQVAGDCLLHVYRFTQETLQPGASLTVPAGYVVDAVHNESAQAAMLPGLAGRLGYVVDGALLRFRREAENDLVRVTLRRTAPDPGPPGLAFRTFEGQANFSEIAPITDGQAPLATTDVSKNRANWHDIANIANPLGVSLSSGDRVEGWRGVIFMPEEATASFRWADLDEDPLDYQAISSSNALFHKASGILLLDGVALDLPERFEVEGTFERRYRCGYHAESYNELKQATESLNDLWASPAGLGGPGFDFSGWCIQEAGPKAFDLLTHDGGCREFYPVNWAFGSLRGELHDWWVYSGGAYRVLEMGYFEAPNDWRDTFLRTDAPGPNVQTVVDDGSPCAPTQWNTHDAVVENEGRLRMDLFGKPDATRSWVGSPFTFGAPIDPPGVVVAGPMLHRQADVGIECARLDLGKLIFRLPRGSQIVQAFMPIRLGGLQYQHWIWEGAKDSGGSWDKATLNGRVIQWHGAGDFAHLGPPEDWEPEPFVEYEDEGMLTMDAFATAYDSRRVLIRNNPAEGELILPTRRIVASGLGDEGVGRTLIVKNEWAMVDVTRLFRSIFGLNDSLAQEFYIAPSIGNPTFDVSADTLAAYLIGQMNTNTLEVTNQFPGSPLFSGVAEGRYARWEDLTLGPPLIRYRIGTTNKVYQLRVPADWMDP
jgi:hypothetical protein